jgi:hypothetical protein
MEKSQFIWSVVVALIAVGLAAPQQAEAVSIKPVHGETSFSGTANITQSGGVNTLNVGNPLAVDSVTEDFIPFANSDATFAAPLTGQGFFQWTGNGSSAALISGSRWNMQTFTTDILNAIAPIDSLKSLTFDSEDFAFIGTGIVQIILSSNPVEQRQSRARFEIRGTGNDFSYTNFTVVTTAIVPEGGSALGLLAIGLVGLVAVEGLRRQIAI